jgi:hypothetical protein
MTRHSDFTVSRGALGWVVEEWTADGLLAHQAPRAA